MSDDQIREALRGYSESFQHDALAVVRALRRAGLEVVDVTDDRHEIEFRADGWTIAHPIRERLDGSLFDCSARWDANDPGIRGRRELAYSDTLGCWAVVARVTKKEQP